MGSGFRVGNTIDKGTKQNPTIDTSRGPRVTSKARTSNGPLPRVPHSPSKADQR